MDEELLGTTVGERRLARRAWSHLEVVHALGIFGPDVLEAHQRLGIDDPLAGYVAARVGPMGPVGPEVATAAFHGFSPAMMHRALPALWEQVGPGEVVDVTRRAAGALLERLTEGLGDEVGRAAELARQAALFHPVEGRPLAAARSSLDWPDEPAHVLWEAATRIRESRGDGHVACLVTAGLDGIEAHLTVAGDTDTARSFLQRLRGWTGPEWQAAIGRLQQRGLLDEEGRLTEDGRRLRRELEERTDALAVPPWHQLGADAARHLVDGLQPVVRRVLDAEILPLPVFQDRDIDPRGAQSPETHTADG